MQRSFLIFGLTTMMLIFLLNEAFAQFYIGPYVGVKSSGLKGTIKQISGGQVSTGNVADAGSTGISAGITVGYQILPRSVLNGWYKLDINIDASYSSFSYLENGFNSAEGAGRYSAVGFSDGNTMVISIDVMPIHRLNIPSFTLLSPYLGLGLGLNIMSTSDVNVGPPNPSGIVTGVGEFKVGMLIYYGTLIRLSSFIQPFVQFKHFIPFGSETQFTETYQAAQGGGSQSYALYIQDIPGYFNFVAGVRFNLN